MVRGYPICGNGILSMYEGNIQYVGGEHSVYGREYSVCGIRIFSVWEVVIKYTRSGFSVCGKRILTLWEEDIQYWSGCD